MHTLGEVAAYLGHEMRGDAKLLLEGLAPLSDAGSADLSFIFKKQYLEELAQSRAGAVILTAEWSDHWQGPCLISEAPYLSFARATQLFDDRPEATIGTHPTAVIDPSAVIGTGVSVGPGAVIGAGASLQEGVVIGANAVIGEHCKVGPRSHIYPGAVLYYGVVMGADCTIHANAVIGGDGFGFAPSDAGWTKIIQLGGVVIGNRVEVGAGTTIDRGALADTVIEDNVIIDDQVHIAHNVVVGEGTGIAACTGIAGSTRIGRNCTLAGQVGVADHLEVADNVHVNGQSRVSKSLTEPGLYASGTPIQPYRDWSKNAVRFEQLSQMAKRVAALEKRLKSLSQGSDEGGED